MLSPMRDLGAHVKVAQAGSSNTAGAPTLITAAAGTDNVERTGPGIDCKDCHSGVLVIDSLAALTAAKTLSLTVKIQESDDDAVADAYDTAETIQAATVVSTGAGNKEATLKVPVDLAGRKRWVRFLVTADLSHTSTDTALYAATFVLGGARRLPAV